MQENSPTGEGRISTISISHFASTTISDSEGTGFKRRCSHPEEKTRSDKSINSTHVHIKSRAGRGTKLFVSQQVAGTTQNNGQDCDDHKEINEQEKQFTKTAACGPLQLSNSQSEEQADIMLQTGIRKSGREVKGTQHSVTENCGNL